MISFLFSSSVVVSDRTFFFVLDEDEVESHSQSRREKPWNNEWSEIVSNLRILRNCEISARPERLTHWSAGGSTVDERSWRTFHDQFRIRFWTPKSSRYNIPHNSLYVRFNLVSTNFTRISHVLRDPGARAEKLTS